MEIWWNFGHAKMEASRFDPEFVLDLASSALTAHGRPVPLTPKCFSMLRHFALNPGRLITRQELLENVWPDTHVSEDLVKDYVRKLRRLLGDDAAKPRVIETARGMGYRLVGDVSVFSIAGARETADPVVPQQPTIAVLPFADTSEGADQRFFTAGIAEDIIAELARFRSLTVIARDSSFLFDPATFSNGTAARDLGAQYFVCGAVQREGGRARIHVQLLEADGGAVVWAEHYDHALEDVFAVQDEIARAVAATLIGHLEEFGRQRAARKRPANLAVYDCLLLGNWHLRQYSKADVLAARRLFSRAIELEPANARAHAELAFSCLIEFWSDWTVAPGEAVNRAFTLAAKAVELDRYDSRAHLYLATAYCYGKSNFEAARRAFDEAGRLNPNDYDVFCLRSWLLALSGESEEGIACAEQALHLSPLTTEDCRVAQCIAAYGARRYDDALSALLKIAAPSNHVNACLAMCYAQLGRRFDATEAMRKFLAAAADAIADYPGTSKQAWRRYWKIRYPFRKDADFVHMLEGLRTAGMPLDGRD